MSQHLLRVTAVLVALVGGAVSNSASAAPYPTIRVKVVESTAESTQVAPAQEESATLQAKPVQNEGAVATASAPTKEAVEASVATSSNTATPASDLHTVTETVAINPIPSEPITKVWQVQVSDGTVREALSRWALDAGWIDHWELDVDIPITANATLATTSDFTEAVQLLAEAVALSEVPFRPCFYSNKVVRAMPYNAMCNRNMARPD